MSASARFLTYMIPMVLQIFLPFYFGNEIIVTSEKLQASLFHSEWFYQSKEFKTATLMFSQSTTSPMKISEFVVFELTLENFLKIINTAYSLCSLF